MRFTNLDDSYVITTGKYYYFLQEFFKRNNLNVSLHYVSEIEEEDLILLNYELSRSRIILINDHNLNFLFKKLNIYYSYINIDDFFSEKLIEVTYFDYHDDLFKLIKEQNDKTCVVIPSSYEDIFKSLKFKNIDFISLKVANTMEFSSHKTTIVFGLSELLLNNYAETLALIYFQNFNYILSSAKDFFHIPFDIHVKELKRVPKINQRRVLNNDLKLNNSLEQINIFSKCSFKYYLYKILEIKDDQTEIFKYFQGLIFGRNSIKCDETYLTKTYELYLHSFKKLLGKFENNSNEFKISKREQRIYSYKDMNFIIPSTLELIFQDKYKVIIDLNENLEDDCNTFLLLADAVNNLKNDEKNLVGVYSLNLFSKRKNIKLNQDNIFIFTLKGKTSADIQSFKQFDKTINFGRSSFVENLIRNKGTRNIRRSDNIFDIKTIQNVIKDYIVGFRDSINVELYLKRQSHDCSNCQVKEYCTLDEFYE